MVQVLILHGWNDEAKSFGRLKSFLSEHGWQPQDLWLGDYISTDDDVRVEDVVKRMSDVIQERIAEGILNDQFDMIIHSTGALVAREWIIQKYPNGGCPVKRLIMLAPANYGSRLAATGKSFLGRVVKGAKNWFQTGTEMLNALELASPYQWDLARRDIFDMTGDGHRAYGPDRVMPFVIIGTMGYQNLVRQIVNEDGADGTIRAAAANLNTSGMTIDFSANAAQPEIITWLRRFKGEIPYAVLPDRDHTSITLPYEQTKAPATSPMLGDLILSALSCETSEAYPGSQYEAIANAWNVITEDTADIARDEEKRKALFQKGPPPDKECFNQYMQLVTFVRDDAGYTVEDYFLEFTAPEKVGSQDMVYFHKHVLEHVHVNQLDAARRCLFLDRSDLKYGLYANRGVAEKQQIAMSITAAPPGRNTQYFGSKGNNAEGLIPVHARDPSLRHGMQGRLFRNQTHLVEIVVPRNPNDNVFKLRQ